jgi:hypothetical protein
MTWVRASSASCWSMRLSHLESQLEGVVAFDGGHGRALDRRRDRCMSCSVLGGWSCYRQSRWQLSRPREADMGIPISQQSRARARGGVLGAQVMSTLAPACAGRALDGAGASGLPQEATESSVRSGGSAARRRALRCFALAARFLAASFARWVSPCLARYAA